MLINKDWLKSADIELKKSKIVLDGKYLACYRSYISGFGAAIAQSGILAASIFYEKKDTESKGNRYAVIKTIMNLLARHKKIVVNAKNSTRLSSYVIKLVEPKDSNHSNYTNPKIPSSQVSTESSAIHDLMRNVDLSIAYLKLALRQYVEIEDSKEDKFKITDYAPKVQYAENTYDMSKDEFRSKFQIFKNNYSSNIGWCFYRDFYKDFTYDKNTITITKQQTKNSNVSTQKQGTTLELNYAARTRYICRSVFTDNHKERNLRILKSLPGKTFQLLTSYPGLLIGSGLKHESGERNDIKLGFLFDYTTGLPYIPGSSIKGVLRSMFPFDQNNSKQANTEKYIDERTAYINSKLHAEYSTEEVKRLALDIFEEGNSNSRDIFYDALITGSENKCKYIMGEDFITPHPSPLLHPNPLQFLKILPKIEFTFKFNLHDSKVSEGNVITAIQKLMLFQNILLDVGVGAKTNVGYGHFMSRRMN